MHRNITPRTAVYLRFLAGLLLCALITIPPLIGTAIWIAVDGLRTMAAYWDEVLLTIGYTLLAFMCWPDSFLVLQRNAWWFGSRLLPALSTVAILAVSLATMEEPVAFLRWASLFLTILIAIVLTFAACHSFEHLGQVRGASRFTLGLLHGTVLRRSTAGYTLLHQNLDRIQRLHN